MALRRSILKLALLQLSVCISSAEQTIDAGKVINLLTEHWRWVNYWHGRTELGGRYKEGKEVSALFFWQKTGSVPALGFCSNDLGECEYYDNIWQAGLRNSEMKIRPGEDLHVAMEEFIRSNFGTYMPEANPPNMPQRRPVQIQAGPPKENFLTAFSTFKLPALEQPESIRERKMRTDKELEGLISSKLCAGQQPGCKTRLLIPFYGDHDPIIFVYRRCSKLCDGNREAVFGVKYVEGHWWQGARDVIIDPKEVRRLRVQIQRALMQDVSR